MLLCVDPIDWKLRQCSLLFCQENDPRTNQATAVLRGLLYSLIKNQETLLSHVQTNYDHAGKDLFQDINAFNALSRIFTNILSDPGLRDTYFVIDALDECVIDLYRLLHFINRASSSHTQAKWIISSRNWPEIEERLGTQPLISSIRLELNPEHITEAVHMFIQERVARLSEAKRYSEKVRDEVHQHLMANSQGTFLWVALVCDELLRTSSWNARKRMAMFPPGLDKLYQRMISQISDSDDAELCTQILAVTLTAYRPLTLAELLSYISMPGDYSWDQEFISRIIDSCGSFLTVQNDSVTFVHQSAKDFLNKELPRILGSSLPAEHSRMFWQSLEIMSSCLRRDIFSLRLPGTSIETVKIPTPNPLATAEYACLYWVDHYQASSYYLD
ncbi:hypothetical protein N7470_009934 [Penicillium chermesinum]|nr:hypothetical protein N7470_009934 [Penicillium chermesinum]